MSEKRFPEIIAEAMKKSIAYYGDAASEEFYARLKNGQLATTHCSGCGAFSFPPRPFCPECRKREMDWVEIKGPGKLYAFTQQDRALRFGKPDVIGLVELDELGGGRLLTRIDAPFKSLRIGMQVELDFVEIEGGMVLHQFRPSRVQGARTGEAD